MSQHKHNDILDELERNGELAMLLSAPPIAFNPVFVDMTGSVTAALLLSVCSQESESAPANTGWQELDAERLLRLTRLSIAELRTARRVLKDLRYIEERRLGFPAKSEFRVDFVRLTEKLLSIAKHNQDARLQPKLPVVH